MKADEQRLLLTIANSTDRHPYVRTIVRSLGMNEKRAAYICLKWDNKGWYDYGVNCLAGWLTPSGKLAAAQLAKGGGMSVDVHEEQGCLGFFGFGGGYMMAKEGRQDSMCNICPLKAVCWDLHKKRSAEFFPDAVAAFEEVAQSLQGPALMRAWYDRADNADPYTVVMGGNIEDGMSVANAGHVKERGAYTLPYPFKKDGGDDWHA